MVLDKEFNGYIGDFDPEKGGEIKLTKYVPDRLEYESNASAEQSAVFSEFWYGPDKGWNAYLDGKKVDFVRANYVLRGMKVPAGKHKIEFKFEPTSFKVGKNVALVSSILILALMGFGFYKLNQGEEITEKEEENGEE